MHPSIRFNVSVLDIGKLPTPSLSRARALVSDEIRRDWPLSDILHWPYRQTEISFAGDQLHLDDCYSDHRWLKRERERTESNHISLWTFPPSPSFSEQKFIVFSFSLSNFAIHRPCVMMPVVLAVSINVSINHCVWWNVTLYPFPRLIVVVVVVVFVVSGGAVVFAYEAEEKNVSPAAKRTNRYERTHERAIDNHHRVSSTSSELLVDKSRLIIKEQLRQLVINACLRALANQRPCSAVSCAGRGRSLFMSIFVLLRLISSYCVCT